jgi:hypothetical protein
MLSEINGGACLFDREHKAISRFGRAVAFLNCHLAEIFYLILYGVSPYLLKTQDSNTKIMFNKLTFNKNVLRNLEVDIL